MKQEQDRIQSHGLSFKEMEELHHNQLHGNKPDMIAANNAHTIKDEFFKKYSDHEIPAYESDMYHVIQESRLFDQTTGQRKSKENIGKYNAASFKFLMDNNSFQGKVTHILHNPETVKGSQPVPVMDDDVDTNDVDTNDAMPTPVDDTPDAPGPLVFDNVEEARIAYQNMTGNKAPNKMSKSDIENELNNLDQK